MLGEIQVLLKSTWGCCGQYFACWDLWLLYQQCKIWQANQASGQPEELQWRQMFWFLLGIKWASVSKISWNSVWNRSAYSLRQRSFAVVIVLLLRFKDYMLCMATYVVWRLNSWTLCFWRNNLILKGCMLGTQTAAFPHLSCLLPPSDL